MEKRYKTFAEFYPYYLSEHQNLICRRLHFFGSFGILALILFVIVTSQWILLWFNPLLGYGFAWIGHFFFEKNRPATFTYPFYSFLGDWIMFKDILLRKIQF